MAKDMTKVIFRKWPGGDVIALFPDIPADIDGRYCMSYQHFGQHGGADYAGVMTRTLPAGLDEYRSLFMELVSIGYTDMKVYKRRRRRR